MATDIGTPLLEARDVTVRFGGLVALNGVNLSVPPSSLVGLVGPNGAGKSTLFGVCSGLLKPNRGTVLLDGHDVTGASAQTRAHLGLARTFQQPELFMGLTVREHLTLAYRARNARRRLWSDMFLAGGFRRSGSDERDRVDAMLKVLSLKSIADEVVDTLPLGTSRLVEVGRALASGPKVVLLDEPMSGLDAHEGAQLAEALARSVSDEGISLLLVDHDVPTVLTLCSRIYVLEFGQLIAEGTPDEIRNNAAVRAAYLGDDPLTAATSASD